MNARPFLVLTAAAAIGLIAAAADAQPRQADRAQRRDATTLFDKLDADGDGKITRKELAAGRQALHQHVLQRLDRNRAGALNQQERAAARRGLQQRRADAAQRPGRGEGRPGARRGQGQPGARRPQGRTGPAGPGQPTEQQKQRRQQMLEKFDADGDGKLDQKERAKANEAAKALRQRMLKRFDADADGKLGPQERQAMQKARRAQAADRPGAAQRPRPAAAPRQRKAQQDRMFKRFDADGDGMLSLDEWGKTCQVLREQLRRRAQGGTGQPAPDKAPRPRRGQGPGRQAQ